MITLNKIYLISCPSLEVTDGASKRKLQKGKTQDIPETQGYHYFCQLCYEGLKAGFTTGGLKAGI
jgi:hypothetical protein